MPHRDVLGGWIPLASRPMIQTNNPEQMAEWLQRVGGAMSVSFGDGASPFLAVVNQVELDGLRLHYCRCDSPARIKFASREGYRQIFVLTGSSQIADEGRAMALGKGATGLIPPSSDFKATYSEGYSHLVLEIDGLTLARKGEMLFGRNFTEIPGASLWRALPEENFWKTRDLVLNLAHQFSSDNHERDLPVVEVTQALKTSFLLEHLGETSVQRDWAPGAGRRTAAIRLEDYIHENWNQPLTIDDIASACGVSVRSVFTQFRQRHGLAPMAYLRDLRLDRARMLLRSGEADVSVIDVAMACGFASFGHFARRYRDRFGELPSATVSRPSAPALR